MMSQPTAVLTSQKTIEWYTPPDVIELVKRVLGRIGLDPASCHKANEIIGALRYFDGSTIGKNGLLDPWFDSTVFLNPPFDATARWVERMTSEYKAGHFERGILLVNSAPGYKWFERLWRRRTVCCLERRLRFVDADGSQQGQAKKGQTLAYFGDDDSIFVDVFTPRGRVFRP